MKQTSRLNVLILVVSVLVGLGNCSAPARAVQNVNFLPLGDSITLHGYYIAPLEALLIGHGYNPTMIANEGYGGYGIAQLDSDIVSHLNHPNVNASNTYILLMIGINDMVGNVDLPNAPARLGTLISHIRANAPLAHLVVAQLTPPNWDDQVDAAVRQFNQNIVPVVQGFGPNVHLVDMYTPFMPDPLPYMGGVHNVHPNQAGGDLMAPVWYQGMTAAPEPGALTILASGLLGTMAYAWRKREKLHLGKRWFRTMNRLVTGRFALLFTALLGYTATVEAVGITGVTSGGYDLRTPPTTPAGETWYYGEGMLLQLDATTAGMLANMRRNGTPYNDYEAGTDLVIFNSLDNIGASGAVPISRSSLENNPETGQLSLTSEYPIYGGFVPHGAAIGNDQPHPYTGTGFGMHYVGFYPADTDQPFPSPVVYRLELEQFRYDGCQFTSQSERMPTSGLRVGATDWYITAPGFSPAIPDGNDLLFPVCCDTSGGSSGVNGVARFQFGSNGWQPVSFVQIASTGSEPSLIRDVDGSLLYSNRSDSVYRLWRATSLDGTWSKVLERGSRLQTPVVLSQAADGTPYFSGNSASSGQPARNTLQITPVNSDRDNLEAAITVLDGYAEFGESPSGQGWDVDHGYGSLVRLADGQWHSILTHRVMARTEHFNASLGTPYTGLYVEEVFSSGDPRPTWAFVAPEPSSGTLTVSTMAGISGFLGLKRAWSKRFLLPQQERSKCRVLFRGWRTRC